MYKRIMVAVDGSSTSEQALREAIKICGADTKILLVTVADNVSIAFKVPYNVEAERRAIVEGAQATLEHAGDVMSQLGFSSEKKLIDLNGFNGSSIPSAIVREGKVWGAELIVVGTHGRRGFNRLIVGSVAENVVRIASVPVLLIREPKGTLFGALNPAEIYSDWPEDEIIGG